VADEGDESEEAGAGDESVQEINGIGPAYGKRLADAGVETVAELADADAAELADASGISEKRIAGWKSVAAERPE
jgi:predicted flap endonuclease-1-like 5' DNA nuclease